MLVNLIYLTILGILVIGDASKVDSILDTQDVIIQKTKLNPSVESSSNWKTETARKKRRISKIADVNKFNNAWNIPELGDEPAQRTISGQNDDEQQMYLAGGFDSSAPAKMKATEDELRKLDLETLEDLILKLHGQH